MTQSTTLHAGRRAPSWDEKLLRAYARVSPLAILRIANIIRYLGGMKDAVVIPCGAMRLVVRPTRSSMHRLLLAEGELMVAERGLITPMLPNDGLIIDVGANIGYYVVMMGDRTSEQVKIICFEPEPTNLEELRENIEINKLQDRVEVIPMAISSTPGTARLKTGLNGMLSSHDTWTDGSESLEVRTTTIDQILTTPDYGEKANRNLFIKIDVEGHELAVLEGMEKTLVVYRPKLFIECHPEFVEWVELTKIEEMLKKYKYSMKFGELRYSSVSRRLLDRWFGRSTIVVHASREEMQKERRNKEKLSTYWLVAEPKSF